MPSTNGTSTQFLNFDPTRDVQCVYRTKNGAFEQISATSYNSSTNQFTCTATHLTYFSLLFKVDVRTDSRPLEIADKIVTVFSILALSGIMVYSIRKGVRWLLNKPVKRSIVWLSLNLLMLNLMFTFTQLFFWPTDTENCLAAAVLLLFWTVSLFVSLSHAALTLAFDGKRVAAKDSSIPRLVLEFSSPYLFATFFTAVAALGTRYLHGLPYLLGSNGQGLQNQNLKFLNEREISGNKLVCFVQGYTFYIGVLGIYFLSMTVVITSYGIIVYRIFYRTHNFGVSKVQQWKMDVKKMAMVFCSIGLAWLFLLLEVINYRNQFGLAPAWLFVIFKLLQPASLFLGVVDLRVLVFWRRKDQLAF